MHDNNRAVKRLISLIALIVNFFYYIFQFVCLPFAGRCHPLPTAVEL